MKNNGLFLSKAAESVMEIDPKSLGVIATVGENDISILYLRRDFVKIYTGAVLDERVGVAKEDLKTKVIKYEDGGSHTKMYFTKGGVKYFSLLEDRELKSAKTEIGFILG